MKLAARIAGRGLIGPGLASWREARAILAGRAAHESRPTAIPAPDALPAVERRRAGKVVRIALAAGLAAAADAGREARELAAIFTSSTGDGDNVHAICETLASDDRSISPTRFHNSVHNAPAGYWGIATGAMQPADCLAAFDASFGAGLLEALGRLAADPSRGVLLIAYDTPYPEPLNAVRPIPDSFAVALVLEPVPAPKSRGGGRVNPAPSSPSLLPRQKGDSSPSPLGEGHFPLAISLTRDPPTVLDDPSLEQLRQTIPAARSLPLLALLARESPGRVVIEYLDDLRIALELSR